MSEATVPLTTTMIKKYAKNPKIGKAQAQRKAMLRLMNSDQTLTATSNSPAKT
jgi:hypothetical protein